MGMGDVKGSGVALAAGGISFYAGSKLAQNVEFLRSKWWATPIAMAAGGHFLKGNATVPWRRSAGSGVIGVAGAFLAMGYLNQPAAAPAQPPAAGFQSRAGDAGAMGDGQGRAGDAGRYLDGTARTSDFRAQDVSEAYGLQDG